MRSQQLFVNDWHERRRSRDSRDDLFVTASQDSKDQSRMSRSHSTCIVNGWLCEKSLKDVQEKVSYDCHDIWNVYDELMEKEKQLQQEMTKVIEYDDQMKKRKSQLLSKKWVEQIFIPLHEKIFEEMSSKNYEKLDKDKRKLYQNYLDHQNYKEGNVYLDVFQSREYDPLCLNSRRPGPLKAATKKLADPLLHLQDKRIEEDRVVVACNSGKILSDKEIECSKLPNLPLIPLGRHGTKCSTWLGMEFRDIQSDVRVRSQERGSGRRNKSNFCLYDCNLPPKESLIAGGRRWQKKKQFPDKYVTQVQLG